MKEPREQKIRGRKLKFSVPMIQKHIYIPKILEAHVDTLIQNLIEPYKTKK
jgi:hypothetical protein